MKFELSNWQHRRSFPLLKYLNHFMVWPFPVTGRSWLLEAARTNASTSSPLQMVFLAKERKLQVVEPDQKFVVSGVEWSDNNRKLVVCGLLANEVRIIDAISGETKQQVDLGEEAYPYSVTIDSKNETAFVSLWGKSSVAPIDLSNGQVATRLPTQSHPTEMRLLDNDSLLLVACANQNSVTVLETQSGKQLEVIQTSLFTNAPNGSTPASLDVSPDGKVLVAANSDNNNLAVFDISRRGQSKSLGFIPVGWYPTCVRFAQDGQSILVSNGKGLTSRSNVHGANPNLAADKTVREYVGGLFLGTLSFIPAPSPEEMAEMTRTAFACCPLMDAKGRTFQVPENHPIPQRPGMNSPIKHCIYVIKENRTYDQVFGDMPTGNGDPSLCIFPESVTPNHHALARQFVQLDNFYVESEVSADGHEWTMAAYATDFVEKTWPISYRGGRKKLEYPAEGKFKIAEPSSGYLWDRCIEGGVDYFSFGEFVDNGPTPNDPCTTNVEALQGHFDPMFRSYDLDYTDVQRAERFIERWKQFEDEGNLPGLIILRLPNDHTYGTRVGKPTPTAMVADNDLALGMVVEAVSNSPAWPETAIFVVEDDAQNGSDHVDAHRTVALAISPYTRGAGLDSTMYSTSSMLRTMELILGLEPMTQFDAAATPMVAAFRPEPDFTPYTALSAQVDLKATNLATAWGAELSEQLDLSSEDAADDLLFGDIVWRSVKGADSPMPAPVRSAFVFISDDDDDDDEDGQDEEETEENEMEEEAEDTEDEQASNVVGQADRTLVIAHRGASGYLPEHSEGAKVLAIAQGADIVEQDVVLTRDGVLVVSHDITMDATTNVADIYPDRARDDGRFYYADFDWSELRQVSLRERSLKSTRANSRFPFATNSSVMRLEDEVALVRGLNQTLGNQVGFHIELKSPSWHQKEFGFHMADKLVALLDALHVENSQERCFIQCFEPAELQYLHNTLKCEFPLVQLMGGRPLGLLPEGSPAGDRLATLKAELQEVAKYADGIGPSIGLLTESDEGTVKSNGFVEAAHAVGLVVHPYTVRKDALPEWCNDVDDLHRLLIDELRVDGFFTDFPDLARAAVDQ